MSAGANAIIARLGLDAGEFRRDLKKSATELAAVQSDYQKTVSSARVKAAAQAEAAFEKSIASQKSIAASAIKDLSGTAGTTGLLSALGSAFSIGAITAAGSAIMDFAGSLQDASDELGIGVESIQGLNAAFAESGASSEVVNKGLVKLSQNIVEARGGNEKLVDTFKSLGVSWADINTLAPDEILQLIAASAKNATDPTARLASIMEVLGKSGAKMAAGLNSGDDLAASMASAVKLTKDEVKALDDAGDSMTRLWNTAKVLAAKSWLALGDIGADKPTNDVKVDPTKRLPGDPGYVEPAEKSVPVSPAAAKAIEEQAKAATDLFRAEEANKDKLADMDADAAQKRVDEETKASEAIAAAQKKEDQECAESANELDTKRADAEQKAAVDLAAKKMENDIKAAEAATALSEKHAAEEAKAADKRHEKFADDKLAGPQAAASARRADRKRDSLIERSKREDDVRARGGHSKADVDAAKERGRPLSDRVARRDKQIKDGVHEKGGDKGKGDDLKGALDGCEMAKSMDRIEKKLGVNQ